MSITVDLPAREGVGITDIETAVAEGVETIEGAVADGVAEIEATTGTGGIFGVDPKTSFLILAGDSKTFLLTQNDGFNSRMAQLTATGGPFEGLTGWVNMGSSGYTLDGFVNDALAGDWVGPASDRADWNFAGTKTGAYSSVATPLANLLAFVATIEDHIHPIICLGHDFNDFALYAANGNLNAADRLDYMLSRLRTAVEAIHEARPNALIVLMTPHLLLPRPYGDVIPSPTAYPDFGDVLATDAALVDGWNDTWAESKRQIVAEYAYSILWDWRRVAGEPDTLTIDATEWPYYTDLAHEAYAGANWLADDLVQVLTGKGLDPSIGKGRLADALAELNTGYALTYDPRYCELHPEAFTRVVADSLIGIGSNYMDIGVPYGTFQANVKGVRPIYVQIGSAAGQVFTSYNAGASGGNTRLTSVSPSAAMQAATVGLDVSVYVARVVGSGDDYVDARAFDYGTYSNTYLCTIANGGSGFIDVAFDSAPGLFRMLSLQQSLAGLSLAVGGATDTTYDLASWTPGSYSGTQIRLLKSGDYSALASTEAVLLVPHGAVDPVARDGNMWKPVTQSNAASVAPALVDAGSIVQVLYSVGACTITLPSNGTLAFDVGTEITYICDTAQTVSFAAGSGAAILKLAAKSLAMSGQGAVVVARKHSTNVWSISGDLA